MRTLLRIVSGTVLMAWASTLFVFLSSTTICGDDGQPGADKLSAYLFVYFVGNGPGQEQIHYAISTDGFNYKALNDNRPVIDSELVSQSGGLRDPHILRRADDKGFYMVATDEYVPTMAWNNHAMVLMKSDDLIYWHWSVVDIPRMFPKQFGDVNRVWAPQTIYDKAAGRYMVYFSMKKGNGPDTLYYAYANRDFTALATVPQPLYQPPADSNTRACIDADIIETNGKFYLFHKAEDGEPGIKLAVSDHLTQGYVQQRKGRVDCANAPVEGAGIFKLNGADEWILMYDLYTQGKYQFTRSKDLLHFEPIDAQISMDFHPRHGTVMPITKAELDRLLRQWGPTRNKTAGAAAGNNPILDGYCADPDILYSQKNHKYYLYPTTDGFPGWSGTYFEAFSSDNLVDWTRAGVILDLKKDVAWADRNAWAPCILERQIDGKYRYYFYFTAAQKIGVAVSDSPTGPFRDSGRPLIDKLPPGVSGGQQIDPDVFTDPVSGKSYLYWGNGYMAAAELNDDMMSIKQNTLKVLTPDRTFREGTHVFYRNGIYYFLWSENDTRSVNYRVRYAMADSPLGPLKIPPDNLVIAKAPERGIYATGHNSTLQVPGKDQWYLVYHRFAYPDGINMGPDAGYHREVCIDRMRFAPDGKILRVEPTHQGIQPLR